MSENNPRDAGNEEPVNDPDGARDPRRIPGYQGLLAHAMIAAAAVDGGIDPEQKFQIARQVMRAGVESGHDPRFQRAMSNPWTPRKLADNCRGEHQRLAVYQAAVSVVDPASKTASGFLEALYIVLGITRIQRAAFHRARRD